MLNQRHVSDVYGPIPHGGNRLPTPAAQLVAQTLSTSMPAISQSAGKVLAQHLHKCAECNPEKGTADAIMSIADDFGLEPGAFKGPEAMERAVHENHPLPAFLNEARRLTHEGGGRKSKGFAKISASKKELTELAEGGFNFGSFASKAASNPFAQIAAQMAAQKLAEKMSGGAKGGFDFGSFSKSAASNPFAQLAAQMAAQKLSLIHI